MTALYPFCRDPKVWRVARRIAIEHGLITGDLAKPDRHRLDVGRARRALAYALQDELGLETFEIAPLIGVQVRPAARLICEHRKETGAPAASRPRRDHDDGEPWAELKEAASAPAWRPLKIIAAVATRYRVSVPNLTGRAGDRRSRVSRFAAMWWLLKLTPLSSSQIGKFFDNRDHTTVLAAERAHMALHGLPRARNSGERCAA